MLDTNILISGTQQVNRHIEAPAFPPEASSLRRKIVLAFAAIAAVVLLFGGLSFYFLYKQCLGAAYDTLSATSRQVALMADSYFKSLDSFTAAQYTQPSMYEVISQGSLLRRQDMLDQLNREAVVYTQQYKQAMRDTAGILLSSYLFVDAEHYYYYPFSYRRDDAENLKIYLESVKRMSSSPLFFPPSPAKPYCYIVRSVNNMPTAKAPGTIIQCISTATFDNILSGASENESVKVYITDTNGVIYAHKDWAKLGQVSDEVMAYRVQRTNIFETKQNSKTVLAKIEPTGWNRLLVMCSIDKRVVLLSLWGQMRTYLAIGTLFLGMVGLAFWVTAHGLTHFLSDMLTRFQQIFKGDYSVRMPAYKDRDLMLLSNAFNGMAGEIHRLIDVVYQEELTRRDSELKFLQAQMNPHFLFNVLTTIRVKAKMDGNETVYQMLFALGELMRAGIAVGDDAMITLDREMRYIEQYLFLQKMRFEDKLSYRLNLSDKDALRCLIPKLCVESIVENAVIHGIEHKREPGSINIDVLRAGNEVRVIVRDDGVGFNPDQLGGGEDQDTPLHSRIGLKNADRRLKLIYGSEYGLTIRSAPGAGACITVSIPWQEGDCNV